MSHSSAFDAPDMSEDIIVFSPYTCRILLVIKNIVLFIKIRIARVPKNRGALLLVVKLR